MLVILIRTLNMLFLHFFFDLSHLVVIVSFYLQMFFVISRIISCRCFTHSFVHYRFEIQQSLNPAPRQSIKSSVKQEEGFSLVFRNSAVSNVGHSSKITKSKSTDREENIDNQMNITMKLHLKTMVKIWTRLMQVKLNSKIKNLLMYQRS